MKQFFTLLIFFSLSIVSYGQAGTISGRVTDASSGDVLPGVSILIKGTTIGVVTDLDGKYTIDASNGQELVYSYVGYIDEIVQVNGQTKIDISLDVDVLSVDEVIVVGYTTQKKSMVTGAISKVRSDDLGKNVPRIEQALQGKTAGVNIMQESGAPGAGMTVRIRGVGSNRNSDPLYIVDGMRTGGIDYLNTNDIESVEILKDGASTAIYGAEGANGVILITTKSGIKGNSVVSYNFNYGIQQPGKTNEVLNAQQYTTYYREGLRHEIESAYEGIDIPDVLLDRALDTYMPYSPDTIGEGTDWLGEIFENAPMQEHNLSISGGTENTSYFASGSFFDQDGIVGGDKANFKRYTGRLRVEHKVKDWLDFGTVISYTHIDKKEIDENNEFGGVLTNAYTIDPITPVYYADSTEFPDKYKSQIYDKIDDVYNSSLRAPGDNGYYGMSEYVQNEIVNPRAQIDNKHEKIALDKVVAGFNLGLKPIEGLVIKTAFDIDLAYQTMTNWIPETYYHSVNFNELNSTYQEIQKWYTYQWENTAQYSKSFGKHSIMGLGGMTIRDYTYNFLNGKGEQLQEESWEFAEIDAVLIDTTRSAAGGGTNNEATKLLSYFGRVQYNYDERYMADFTLRADASSKLSKENRRKYFPSVSVGWNISNESFWTVSSINYLKLRASWGQNGSISSLGTTETQSLITSGGQSNYFVSGGTSLIGSEPEQIANPDVTWETSEQTNLGLDVRFIQSKLAFSVDYYNKKTVDLITESPIPFYVGNDKPNGNFGTVINKGLELELTYKDGFSDFNYQVGVNAAYNKNEMTELTTPLAGTGLGGSMVTQSEEGYPLWYFYGYETAGIFNSFDEIRAYTDEEGNLIQPLAIPGDVKFVDKDGDGSIGEGDKGMIGSPHPDWTFGLNIDLNYKDFDFAISFFGSLGNDVYLGTHRTDITKNNKPLYFYEEAWTPDNLGADFPRYTVNDDNNNFQNSDLFVFDGSFIRMQNIELGYTLPHKISDRVKIQRLRIYVSGKNLLVFNNYPGGDSEIGNSKDEGASSMKSVGVDRGLYPRSKVYSFGVNLTL